MLGAPHGRCGIHEQYVMPRPLLEQHPHDGQVLFHRWRGHFLAQILNVFATCMGVNSGTAKWCNSHQLEKWRMARR
jgi:hypothetical protein